VSTHDCFAFGCDPARDIHFTSLGGPLHHQPDTWPLLDTLSLTVAVSDILKSRIVEREGTYGAYSINGHAGPTYREIDDEDAFIDEVVTLIETCIETDRKERPHG
jgi:hypothetical protein